MALVVKVLGAFPQRLACRAKILPPWDGKAIDVSEAHALMAGMRQLPRRIQRSVVGRRVTQILDFLCRRGNTQGFDDQLRALADNDVIAQENSYALTRFITWAIPILGFLGTVMGITGAISGVTPEVLEHSLSTVTDGLALAFDATALALGLTMLAMFLSFIAERAEQSVLDAVDLYVDRELAHRFARGLPGDNQVVEAMRQHSDVILEAAGNLVQRQAEVWSRSLAALEKKAGGQVQQDANRLTSALEASLEKANASHLARLREHDEVSHRRDQALLQHLEAFVARMEHSFKDQQTAWSRIQESLAVQLQAIARLQEGEGQLARLQEALNQNLAAVAGAGSFEQGMHSLTAAIHLLTAKAALVSSTQGSARPGGKAA